MRILLSIIITLIFCSSSFALQRGISKVESSQSEDKTGRQFALLIGNNNYQDWDPLKTAIRDVERLRDVLLKRYGYKNKDVILVRDARRSEILGGLDGLRRRSGADDKVLVYYAGHGVFDKKQDGFWVPVDGELENNFDYISNADVLNRLGSIEARHKLLISDSCFSGNLLTRGMSPVSQSKFGEDSFFLEKNKLKSVQGFASGGNEPVYDGGPKWGGIPW